MEQKHYSVTELKRLIRRQEVETLTGVPRASLYDKMAAGEFPKPVSLGGRAKGWVYGEVIEWIEAAIARRDAAQTTAHEVA